MIEIKGIKLYDTRETARFFNVTEHTISNLRRRGELRSVRIGRRKYISEDTIRDFLNGLIVAPRRQLKGAKE